MAAIQHNYESPRNHEQFDESKNACTSTNKLRIYRMTHRYSDKTKLVLHYNQQILLSVVVFQYPLQATPERHYGACFISRGRALVLNIEREMETNILVGGKLVYWYWRLHLDQHTSLESLHVVDHGILLPMLCDPERVGDVLPPNYYTVTTQIWNAENTVRLYH